MPDSIFDGAMWVIKGFISVAVALGWYTVKKNQAELVANKDAIAAVRADSERALAAYKLEAFQTFVTNPSFLRLEEKIDNRFDSVIEEIRAAPRCPYQDIKPCQK